MGQDCNTWPGNAAGATELWPVEGPAVAGSDTGTMTPFVGRALPRGLPRLVVALAFSFFSPDARVVEVGRRFGANSSTDSILSSCCCSTCLRGCVVGSYVCRHPKISTKETEYRAYICQLASVGQLAADACSRTRWPPSWVDAGHCSLCSIFSENHLACLQPIGCH